MSWRRWDSLKDQSTKKLSHYLHQGTHTALPGKANIPGSTELPRNTNEQLSNDYQVSSGYPGYGSPVVWLGRKAILKGAEWLVGTKWYQQHHLQEHERPL